MRSRLDAILDKYDGVLLTSPHNMRYFSGFSGGEGAVVIVKDTAVVFTDSRYTEQAQHETEGYDVKETNDYLKSACELFEELSLKTVVLEDDILSAAGYKKLTELCAGCEFIFGASDINKLRMVKTADELDKIRRAEEIGCKAFEHILDFIRPGVAEKDIALEIEYFMRKLGAEGLSFDTIAISGARTSLPHGVPTGKSVELGDFVTLDFGCVLDGYCSDMTRTVVVGKASDEQKKIYNIVREAQQMGLDTIRAGILGSDADKAARDYIESCGYGQYFRHSLGHGVGLLVHELPNLSPKSQIVLEENMVVSCEPGIYIPSFGGVRIEDLVCVTRDCCENLTRVTKDLIEL
jgi:Xaa-Pro aminopeptidase